MRILGSLLLFSTLLFFACESGTKADPPKSERQKLYDEVMAIHDEMMPKIKPIRDAQKKILTSLQDSVKTIDEKLKNDYLMAYTYLENADKEMNTWMKQFKAPTKDMTDDAATLYLKDQMKKVQQMKMIMLIFHL